SNSAYIGQTGRNNTALIDQNGSNNDAAIGQLGVNSEALISQDGNDFALVKASSSMRIHINQAN
ncbi:curlin repeat-containing protein, partial [Vibrio breoganii]